METQELHRYTTILLITTMIAFGIVLYTITKEDLSKKAFRMVMTVLIIVAIMLAIVLLEVWI
jgi:VIT1/CCC1 family predicted Fe2+/Mn2+ transporter